MRKKQLVNSDTSEPQLIPQYPFSSLTAVQFLQTFLNEMLRHSDHQSVVHRDKLIEQMGLSAGENFESAYRYEFANTQPFTPEQYAELIIAIKARIGGKFTLASCDNETIRVVNTHCPFGERVKDFPELCHMTSSVFGGVAARNFGYAKVELKKRIATHDGMCDVLIHTNQQHAAKFAGTEYRSKDVPVMTPLTAGLEKRIEERLRKTWCSINTVHEPSVAQKHIGLVAQSPVMQRLLLAVETVAPTLATVLLTGETGVGKEVIARATHAMSDRWNHKFVAVNCGAIPETLIESTLFGHEKGAFTGAHEVHYGLFHRAEGGTLFLDEVNTLSLSTQIKLLRVIQEGEYDRVGGNQTLTANVRIVAASNQPLSSAVEQGLFRSDLYYRLNVVCLSIPALRERIEDIPPLVEHILSKLREKYHKSIHHVSACAMAQLLAHPWPGNVRELENVLERCFLFTNGSRIEEVQFNSQMMSTNIDRESTNKENWKVIRQKILDETEKRYLELMLTQYQGDIKMVAEWLGLTPRSVYLKLSRLGLEPGLYRR